MKEYESKEIIDILQKEPSLEGHSDLSDITWYGGENFPQNQIDTALDITAGTVEHPVFGSGYAYELGVSESLSQIHIYPKQKIATVTNEDDFGQFSTRHYLINHLTTSQEDTSISFISAQGKRRTKVTFYKDGSIDEQRIANSDPASLEIDIFNSDIKTMEFKNQGLSLSEAAEFLGCGVENVRYLVKKKKLSPVKRAGRLFISSFDIENYKATGKRRKRSRT